MEAPNGHTALAHPAPDVPQCAQPVTVTGPLMFLQMSSPVCPCLYKVLQQQNFLNCTLLCAWSTSLVHKGSKYLLFKTESGRTNETSVIRNALSKLPPIYTKGLYFSKCSFPSVSLLRQLSTQYKVNILTCVDTHTKLYAGQLAGFLFCYWF